MEAVRQDRAEERAHGDGERGEVGGQPALAEADPAARVVAPRRVAQRVVHEVVEGILERLRRPEVSQRREKQLRLLTSCPPAEAVPPQPRGGIESGRSRGSSGQEGFARDHRTGVARLARSRNVKGP